MNRDVVIETTPQAVVEAAPHPCSQCPWRNENHGKPHPHGWYAAKNRARLWARLRRGESMTCHPTDPNNPLPEGWEPGHAKKDTPKGEAARLYREATRNGMTPIGLHNVVSRWMFGGTILCPGPKINRDLDLTEAVSRDGFTWSPPAGAR